MGAAASHAQGAWQLLPATLEYLHLENFILAPGELPVLPKLETLVLQACGPEIHATATELTHHMPSLKNIQVR